MEQCRNSNYKASKRLTNFHCNEKKLIIPINNNYFVTCLGTCYLLYSPTVITFTKFCFGMELVFSDFYTMKTIEN